jgi:hypothetical protein
MNPMTWMDSLASTWKEIAGVTLFLVVLILLWSVDGNLHKLQIQLAKLEKINNNLKTRLEQQAISLSKLNEDFQKYDEINKSMQANLRDTKELALNSMDLATNHGDAILKLQKQERTLWNNEYQNQADLPGYLDKAPRDNFDITSSTSGASPDVKAPVDDSAVAIAADYQEAVYHGDRSALRRMASEEMNITQDSEEALLRRTASATTQLQIVKGGGSYLLIRQDDRHWLVPTFQTLTSFMTSQPAKGLFSYEREAVSSAELRRPAEVRDEGGMWNVVTMGVVAVPT